eukprot:3925493-Alexandrium_andersonii.AAC.1
MVSPTGSRVGPRREGVPGPCPSSLKTGPPLTLLQRRLRHSGATGLKSSGTNQSPFRLLSALLGLLCKLPPPGL